MAKKKKKSASAQREKAKTLRDTQAKATAGIKKALDDLEANKIDARSALKAINAHRKAWKKVL